MCELEVDAIAADILNHQQQPSLGNLATCHNKLISEGIIMIMLLGSGSYPGLAAIWEEEKQRRLLLGDDTPLSAPPSQGTQV